ncbi:MAG TPA: DLW-39 family protein [Beutenbergiaceae bacterium]|nr:DLW-39 family protein [Beutenbergiaceae bacterium]
MKKWFLIALGLIAAGLVLRQVQEDRSGREVWQDVTDPMP